jgi:hypothetical protein
MADDQHALNAAQTKPNGRLRFSRRPVSLAAARRLVLRNTVVIEVPSEVDPAAEAAKEQKEADEKYEQGKTAFFETARDERNRLIDSKGEQSKTYDQTILTFSAGAIGLSITFVEKIAASPVSPWLLYLAWSCFGFAVFSVIVSFVVSQKAFQHEIDAVDAAWAAVRDGKPSTNAPQEEPKPDLLPNFYTVVTRNLNRASGTFFVLGIAFFVAFGISNWPVAKHPAKIDPVAIKIEVLGGSMADRMVVTTSGPVVNHGRGNTPSTPMLQPAPQPPAPAPTPAPTTAPTTTAKP